MTDVGERANKQERKRLLEMLAGIIAQKKNCVDAGDHDATEEVLAARESASSSLECLVKKEPSESEVPFRLSAASSRNRRTRGLCSSEAAVEHVRNVNPRFFRKSQRELSGKKHILFGDRIASSKHHSQPLMSRGMKRKSSGLSGSSRRTAGDRDCGDSAAVLQSRKVVRRSDHEVARTTKDDQTSRQNSQQVGVVGDGTHEVCPPLSTQKCETRVEEVKLESGQQMPAKLGDADDFFRCPPKKIRLVYRDKGIKPSADGNAGLTTQPLTEKPSPLILPDVLLPSFEQNRKPPEHENCNHGEPDKKPLHTLASESPVVASEPTCRSSSSPWPNSGKQKEHLEPKIEKHDELDTKKPLIECPPLASEHLTQPAATCNAQVNRSLPSANCKQIRRPPELSPHSSKRGNPGGGKSPFLGRSTGSSRNGVRPLMSFSSDSRMLGPHVNSDAGCGARYGKKPWLHSNVQTAKFAKADRNDHSRWRDCSPGGRMCQYPPAKSGGGRGGQVMERSGFEDYTEMFEGQHTPRFAREGRLKLEQPWRQNEEAWWHETNCASWSHEEELDWECHDARFDEPLREDQFVDLRQKISAGRCYANERRRDEGYSYQGGWSSSVDYEQTRRRNLLPTPPHQLHHDLHEDTFYAPRKHLVRCFSGNYQAHQRQYSDDGARLDVDHGRYAPCSDYSRSSYQEEPLHSWCREVGHWIFCLIILFGTRRSQYPFYRFCEGTI